MIKGIFALGILVLLNHPVFASTWTKTYTQANKITIANSIEPTNDGGFLAAGTSYTSVSDAASFDIVLMKVDSSGNQRRLCSNSYIRWCECERHD